MNTPTISLGTLSTGDRFSFIGNGPANLNVVVEVLAIEGLVRYRTIADGIVSFATLWGMTYQSVTHEF